MRSTKSTVLFVFALALFLGAFAAPRVTRAAFGVSPPFLNTDHLTPGVTYTQTVYLVQDQPNVDLPIKATLNVPDSIASWFTLDTGYNFVIPAGTHQFPVHVSIHVPDGQALGKYTGDLSFTSQPSQSGQVTIALGVDVAINLTVGSGIFEQYSVPLITFPDIEEGWNPKVYVKFQNDGNIPESFDSATFDLYDQYDSQRLAYITKNGGFPETPAFTTQEYTVDFPTDFHLGVGQYWGVVTFYKNQQVVATQKTVFNVLKAGAISGQLGVIEHYIGANMWIVYLVGVLALALVGFGVRRFRRRAALVTAHES